LKYKILYLVSSLINVGPNKQQYYIFKYINRKKFNPFVLTLYPEISNSIMDTFKDNNIKVSSLMLSRIGSYYKSRKYVKQYIAYNKIDLIHSFGLRCDSVSLDLGIPSLISIRNYPYYEYPTLYNKILGNYLAYKHIKIIRKHENKVVCSESLANAFKEKNELNVKIIQNGIDTNIYQKYFLSNSSKNKLLNKYNILPGAKVFISASNLIPRKNIELIIKTFKKYFNNKNKYILIIAGDGPERKRLEFLSKNTNNVLFIGNIKNIEELYKLADYFISASFAEGLPNSVLEAMSCGLPCLLSNINPHKEILINNNIGRIFNCFSIEDLRNKMIEILSLDYDLLSINATLNVKKYFNAQTMSMNYQREYSKIIEGLGPC
jgi:glycosyltransferase involved in cell wall biosynthesis